jgi:hypothetical protein
MKRSGSKLQHSAAGLLLITTPISILQGQQATKVPVLTVCEVLRNISMFRGASVVIVGRTRYTFDGEFLFANCEADSKILIGKHRWPSIIAESAPPDRPQSEQPAMPAGLDLLQQKRASAELEQTPESPEPAVEGPHRTGSTNQRQPLFEAHWVAIYGTFESPTNLVPPRVPRAPTYSSAPGTGFGANGSVPAEIKVLSTKLLD